MAQQMVLDGPIDVVVFVIFVIAKVFVELIGVAVRHTDLVIKAGEIATGTHIALEALHADITTVKDTFQFLEVNGTMQRIVVLVSK